MTDASEGELASQEDLVAEKSTAKPSPNPFAHAASISVSVPETVEIKLVDASALNDYEVWVLLTSILSSVVVGFTVATVQASGENIQSALGIIAVVSAVLMAICGNMAWVKRSRLNKKTRRIKFAIGDQVE